MVFEQGNEWREQFCNHVWNTRLGWCRKVLGQRQRRGEEDHCLNGLIYAVVQDSDLPGDGGLHLWS